MNRTVLTFNLMATKHSSISPHSHIATKAVSWLYWFDGFQEQSWAVSWHTTIYISCVLFYFRSPQLQKGFYEGVTHQKFHHHQFLPRRERNTLNLTLHDVFSPSIKRVTQYSTLWPWWLGITFQVTFSESLTDQQQALRDRYQSSGFCIRISADIMGL